MLQSPKMGALSAMTNVAPAESSSFEAIFPILSICAHDYEQGKAPQGKEHTSPVNMVEIKVVLGDLGPRRGPRSASKAKHRPPRS